MTDVDLIIIGAGPAGLTAAQYGARSNLSVLVLEQLVPGGQVLLLDVLENYPGIAEGKTGYDFSEDLRRQAESFGAKFLNEPVKLIQKEGDIFTVTLGNGGKKSAYSVVIATGRNTAPLMCPAKRN